jgi:hypothetical protein
MAQQPLTPHMPQWLCNQLMRAFLSKNRKQIRLLNDSWFFYRTRLNAGKGQNNEESKSR